MSANPVLLCFDGSGDSKNAISSAGRLLGSRPAVLVTVSEPIRLWEPSDPASILDAPIGKLLSKALELEEIADKIAQEQVTRGVQLAGEAGFDASGRVVRGKAWKAIRDVADEIDAAVIVLGARGLSRVASALLGSVSAAVSVHACRPVLIIHRRTPPTKREDAGLERPAAGPA
jgi:nucleotide-binding universal stress UspA family protein